MAEAPEDEEDLGGTKVLDESDAPAVTFAEGKGEELGEGVEEEDVADENELQRLIEAVREGDQDVIDELLLGDEEHPPMTGFFVDSIFPDSGLTPLHWLTVEGHVSVAQWFIDEGQVSVVVVVVVVVIVVVVVVVVVAVEVVVAVVVAQWFIDEGQVSDA